MSTEPAPNNESGNNQRTLRIPKGFQSLLEGFAREVLRAQPPDIYEFGAVYFDKMVRSRSESGLKCCDQALNSYSSQREKAQDQLHSNGTAAIQSPPATSDGKSNGTSTSDPALAHGMDNQHSSETAAASADSGEPIDIDLNDPEVQAAAAKIQKGWGNRRAGKKPPQPEMQQQQVAEKPPEVAPETKEEKGAQKEEEEVDIDLNDPEVQAAALKIQKGWGTRKLAGKKAPS